MNENQEQRKKPIPPLFRIRSRDVIHFSISSKQFEFPANTWKIEDVVNFVFPSVQSPEYFDIACKFMRFLFEKGAFGYETGVDGRQIGEWRKSHQVSKSTLYNVILRKLHTTGLVDRKRIGVGEMERTRKESNKKRGRPMVVWVANDFASHLSKLIDGWKTVRDNAERDYQEKIKKESLSYKEF